MRLFRKICFVLMAVCLFLPAISVILPPVLGLNGEIIEMGSIDINGGDGAYAMTAEPDTWADYLVAPLFAEDVNVGVSGAFLGALSVLQDAGVTLSTPVVFAVGVSIVMIMVEFIDLLVSLFVWIPKQVKSILERG